MKSRKSRIFVRTSSGRAERYRARRAARSWMLTASSPGDCGRRDDRSGRRLKGGVPGLPKQPPYIAAAQGPTKVLPPSDDTVAAPNDAGANLLKDNTQPAHVKVVANEEQPVDLNALASSDQRPPSRLRTRPPTLPAVKATVDTPRRRDAVAPPPPVASQFPEPKPVRTVHLRPDGTPIPSTLVASADATGAVPAIEAAKAKPAMLASTRRPTRPRMRKPSTPKLELAHQSCRGSRPPASWSARPTRPFRARSRRRRTNRFNSDPPPRRKRRRKRARHRWLPLNRRPSASAQQAVQFDRRHQVERLGRSACRAEVRGGSQERHGAS